MSFQTNALIPLNAHIARGLFGCLAIFVFSLFLTTIAGAQTTQQPPSGQSVTGTSGAAAGEAVLNWTVDDTGGLPILRSRLRYKERGAGNPWHRINIRSAAMTHTLTGLDSDKRYVAQVRVWNTAGGTGWSRNSAPFSPAVPVVLNRLPTVSIDQGNSGRVETNTALALSATASDDGTIENWVWTAEDSAGNDVTSNVFAGATDGASASFEAAEAGLYTVTVTVTDDGNLTATASLRVMVLNALALPQENPATDATLSALTLTYEYYDLNAGQAVRRDLALSPAFDSDTTTYNVSLARAARYRGLGSVLISVTPTNPNAHRISVQRNSFLEPHTVFNSRNEAYVLVENGNQNRYYIHVTAENGRDILVYTVNLAEALARPPTVSIVQTSPQNISTGTDLTLGAQGNDPDGGTVSYAWTARSGGNDVTSSVFSAGADTATATFNTATAGTYTVTVTVTDEENETRSASLTVNATDSGTQPNQLPTVSIEQSSPQDTTTGTNLTLEAVGSDPDGGTVTYAWTAEDSNDNVVTSSVFAGATNTATATFNAATAGTYTVTVTVTDDENATATASLTVNATGAANPTVSIVQDNPQDTMTGTNLTLEAVGSDPDGGAVTYVWSAEDSNDNVVTSSAFAGATNTATATFNVATAGTYTVTVTVTDDEGATATASLTVNASDSVTQPNQPPTVSIQQTNPQDTTTGTNLTLEAVGNDPDGGTVSYSWTARSGGNDVTSSVFTGADTATVTLNAAAAGTYTVTVTVTDDENATATASLTVNVTDAPAVDLSLRLLSLSLDGLTVRLDPRFDPETTDYTAILARSTRGDARLTFYAKENVAANVGSIELFRGTDSQGTFSGFGVAKETTGELKNGVNNYRIVVTGTGDSPSTLTYRVVLKEVAAKNPTVSIDQGNSVDAEINANLRLSATANDPDGGRLKYDWTATLGGEDATAAVFDTTTTTGSVVFFNAAAGGRYTVTVTVTDDEGVTASDTVTVTATESAGIGALGVAINPAGPLYVTVGTNQVLRGLKTGTGNVADWFWSAYVPDGSTTRRVTDEVLTGANTISPTFRASVVGEYRIGLVVYDADGNRAHAGQQTVFAIPEGASSDATLSALKVTRNPASRHPMILVPPFSPTTYAYSVVEPLLDSRIDDRGQKQYFRSTTRPNAVTEDYGIITTVDAGSLNVTATVNQSDATLSGSFPYTSVTTVYSGGRTQILGSETVTDLRMTSGGEIAVGPFEPGDNVLTLTVTAQDGTTQDYTVRVKRKNDGTMPPVATITGNTTVAVGADLALDGSGSTDPDGGALIGHIWNVKGPDGRYVTADVLGDAASTTAQVTFNAATDGIYTVALMVLDDDGDVDSTELTVTVGAVGNQGPSVPTFSVSDAEVQEGPGATLAFTVTRSGPAGSPVTIDYATSDITAVAGQDYEAASGTLTFAVGDTRHTVHVTVLDDAHDEGRESLLLILSNASTGAEIADGYGFGWITNTDPMPAAWLARFGRTVADQALDGVSARLKASRTSGFEGTLGGQAFDARGSATVTNSGESGEVRSTTMTAAELLRSSAFAMTGRADSAGGTLAFWGRGAQTRFDGLDGTLTLDGSVTTGMLGMDYARSHWTLGLALVQSEGDGDYVDGNMQGAMESSLTAVVPYAAWQASEQFGLWGAAGFGSGETTLTPAGGSAMETDIDWNMLAAGLRSELLASSRGGGMTVTLISDALLASTSSDSVDGMVATDTDVSRLRVGLEGSWTLMMEGGGRLEPRLEIGARLDDGDAETGTGIDFGGGISWSDPASGISFSVEGRSLLTHEADGREETGYAASLAFDPNPSSRRGLSLALRQDWGDRPTGGLETLFAPDPLSSWRGGNDNRRWTAEAAYGIVVFGGRFTSGPLARIGLALTSREYSLGWQVMQENRTTSDLSASFAVTRREGDADEADQRLGLELKARW